MFSDNAPTLDIVRISNDRARVAAMGALRGLGPTRASLFVADLGDTRQIHPRTRIAGYHVAILPHPKFEVGAEVIDAMGGNGGQPASFGDRVLDAVPIFDMFRRHSDFEFSNKMAGVDAHWRVPSWSGFELYAEDGRGRFRLRRFRAFFSRTVAIWSAHLCRASPSAAGSVFGPNTTRQEFAITPQRLFIAHMGICSAITGPSRWRVSHGRRRVEGGCVRRADGAFEVRSGNGYGSGASNPTDSDFHFTQVTASGRKARERRGTWAPDVARRGPRLRATAGVEHVTNFGFVAGQSRNNALAESPSSCVREPADDRGVHGGPRAGLSAIFARISRRRARVAGAPRRAREAGVPATFFTTGDVARAISARASSRCVGRPRARVTA